MMPQSCDTMVALPGATRHGQTLFAKNSDRPHDECQPLVQQPRQTHQAGSLAGCQFVPVPQVATTYRHVGSRPFWCWGYEHGFNEHQVVIGNEALPSRLPAADSPKLVGMELIRLGLERGRTAAEAVAVMTGLIEQFGQGQFRNNAGVRTYDNAYIVADPHEAYVIETTGHTWATRRVQRAVGISNIRSLTTDWTALSPNAVALAHAQGWLSAAPGLANRTNDGGHANDGDHASDGDHANDGGHANDGDHANDGGHASDGGQATQRFDYSVFGVPGEVPVRAVGRRARSCGVLARDDGAIDVRTMLALLRDHTDGAAPDAPFQEALPSTYASICMHPTNEAGQLVGGNTAASLVADLCADDSRLPVYWCSFYSPCLGVFFPVFSEGTLPAVLAHGDARSGPASDVAGGASGSVESPWWLFHDLARLAQAGEPDQTAEAVALLRQTWRPLEEEFLETAYVVAAESRHLITRGNHAEAERRLSQYMAQDLARVLATGRTLLERLQAQHAQPRQHTPAAPPGAAPTLAVTAAG